MRYFCDSMKLLIKLKSTCGFSPRINSAPKFPVPGHFQSVFRMETVMITNCYYRPRHIWTSLFGRPSFKRANLKFTRLSTKSRPTQNCENKALHFFIHKSTDFGNGDVLASSLKCKISKYKELFPRSWRVGQTIKLLVNIKVYTYSQPQRNATWNKSQLKMQDYFSNTVWSYI